MTIPGQVERIPEQQQHMGRQQKCQESKSPGRLSPKEKNKSLKNPGRAEIDLRKASKSYEDINGPANVQNDVNKARMSQGTEPITGRGKNKDHNSPGRVKQKKIRYILLYTKNYPYKDALEHKLCFQAALSACLPPWPKKHSGR